MAKEGATPEKNKKSRKIIPIDNIPSYSHQPRSTPPKRRTDFSVFICNHSSLSNPGSSPNSSSGEGRSSSVTTSSLQERIAEGKKFKCTFVKCRNSHEERSKVSSKLFYVSLTEDESVVGEDLGSNRDGSKEKGDSLEVLESTPCKSTATDSNGDALSPGSIVWARTACQMWWPAQIMEERSTLSDQASDGQVYVQFYGNHHSAWVDPTTDISSFEDSFEEKSCNSSRDFQDALKQALQRKEQPSSSRKLTHDMSLHSDEQDHLFDKWTSSSSSRRKDDSTERRRGKRERKRKVHFDEVACPLKTERKARRLKIMRYLGLIAPAGSPF